MRRGISGWQLGRDGPGSPGAARRAGCSNNRTAGIVGTADTAPSGAGTRAATANADAAGHCDADETQQRRTANGERRTTNADDAARWRAAAEDRRGPQRTAEDRRGPQRTAEDRSEPRRTQRTQNGSSGNVIPQRAGAEKERPREALASGGRSHRFTAAGAHLDRPGSPPRPLRPPRSLPFLPFLPFLLFLRRQRSPLRRRLRRSSVLLRGCPRQRALRSQFSALCSGQRAWFPVPTRP